MKRKVYADIAPRMKPGAILATNTSSIPLETLREENDVTVHLEGADTPQ